jgi:hypothetical protein
VAQLRWVLVFLLWAALDLSAPLLVVPVEAFEESEEAAHRAAHRRRSWQHACHARPTVDQEARSAAVRLTSLVATATPRWAREARVLLKLPPSGPPPDSASDDH